LIYQEGDEFINIDSILNNDPLLNLSNSVGIDEIIPNMTRNDKIYDLLGRELKEAPNGLPYIQNRKKYIKFY